MRNTNKNLVIDGDMSADFTSDAVDISNVISLSIYMKYTGIPAGVLMLQFSDDGVNYYMPTGGSKTLAGVAGEFVIHYLYAAPRWMRIFYDFTSDTGVLNATFTLKGE